MLTRPACLHFPFLARTLPPFSLCPSLPFPIPPPPLLSPCVCVCLSPSLSLSLSPHPHPLLLLFPSHPLLSSLPPPPSTRPLPSSSLSSLRLPSLPSRLPSLLLSLSLFCDCGASRKCDGRHRLLRHRGRGATAARLTPDQKVGSSNLSALTLPAIIPVLPQHMVKLHWPLIAPFLDPGLCRSVPVTHVFGFSFPPLWALLSFAHPLLHCLV